MESTEEMFGKDFGAERMWGLKELANPEAVSWWPLAPGWYVVAAVLLMLLAWLAWRRIRRWQHDQYRRDALGEIQRMSSDEATLHELPSLIRATALAAYPRADVAALRGAAWIDWLNASAGKTLFASDDALVFDALVYAPGGHRLSEDDRKRLLQSSKRWTRWHRAGI